MNINENRVREYAHQIWQAEGCPDGQAYRHWEMACELVSDESENISPEQSAPQHTTVSENDLDSINKPAGNAKAKALKKSASANATGMKNTSVERTAPSDKNSSTSNSRRAKVVDEFAIEPQSAPEKVSFAKSDTKKSGRSSKAQLLNDVVDTEIPEISSGFEGL